MQSDVYNIFDPIGLKFLTRLRLDFSHLNEHRFRHNFQDYLIIVQATLFYIKSTERFSGSLFD